MRVAMATTCLAATVATGILIFGAGAMLWFGRGSEAVVWGLAALGANGVANRAAEEYASAEAAADR